MRTVSLHLHTVNPLPFLSLLPFRSDPPFSSITPTLSLLPPLLPDEFPFHRAARVNRLRVLRPLIPTCSPRRSGEARPSTTHPPPFLAPAAFIWPPIHDRPTTRTPRHVGCYSSLRPRSRAHHRRYGACLAHQVPGAAPAQQPWRQPALHHLQLLRTLTPRPRPRPVGTAPSVLPANLLPHRRRSNQTRSSASATRRMTRRRPRS